MALLSIVPVSGSKLPPKVSFIFEGEKGKYEIFTHGSQPLLTTEYWRLYVTKLPSGQMGFMKIASNPAGNEIIDQEVTALETLLKIAADLDEEARGGGQRPLFNGALFPNVVESLMNDETDPRSVVFLGFHMIIATYQQLIPLSVATQNDRVDLKTATWILSKTLKLLDFVHSLGYSIGNINASNILLETNLHGVFVLDFSQANENATETDFRHEIGALAVTIWDAIGGTEISKPPHDPEIMDIGGHERFVNFLKSLIEGREVSAANAQDELLALADEIWPKVHIEGDPKKGLKRQFHPWVTYPRD